MTWPWHGVTLNRAGEFARARARAEVDALAMRDRAVRTVAEQSVDADDYRRLLSMLGLDHEVQSTPPRPSRPWPIR
jgi:hypothetical protein